MKITGGIFRGKNVESRKDGSLRPTTGRIREVIFNILQHGRFLKNKHFIDNGREGALINTRVVDIFCGTGALGLEALSRGAKYVTFIDQDSKTLAITRENIKELGVMEQSRVIRSDSTMLPKASHPCDLVFIDPPYNKGLITVALKSLRDNGWMNHGAIVIVEHSKHEEVNSPEGFIELDVRTHDKTVISVLQYQLP